MDNAEHSLNAASKQALPAGSCALELEIETGRTHQIRRHCADAGLPLLGDRRYGLQIEGYDLQLQAAALAFDWQGERCSWEL